MKRLRASCAGSSRNSASSLPRRNAASQTRLAKEFNIPTAGPQGSPGTGGATGQKTIADACPGDWINLDGKVVSLATPPSPVIAQSGIIADESGAIRFVVWTKANAPKMKEGSWYHIESAVVDEYKNIPNLKVHSGTTITAIDKNDPLIPSPLPIKDQKPGIGSVRAKVIQEWEATHDRMLQSGLLGDETATVKFVIWKDPGKERLAVGSVYSIFYAQVDEFNERLSLNLTGATIMQEEGDIVTATGGDAEVRGAIVHVAPGSGIIKRCRSRGAIAPFPGRTTARSMRSSQTLSTTCGSRDGWTMGRKHTVSS